MAASLSSLCTGAAEAMHWARIDSGRIGGCGMMP
jgi:hypothetical protein